MSAIEELHVCYHCFDDCALSEFVENSATESHCDFCDENSDEPIAVEVSEVAREIEQALYKEYDDPANWLGYVSADGGYQGPTYGIRDLLETEGLTLPRDDDSQLIETIVSHIQNDLWCQRNPFSGTEDEVLTWSWERFCEVVKHQRRYFFLDETKDSWSDELGTRQILAKIGESCDKHELVTELDADNRFYRVRKFGSGGPLTGSYDFGPPPAEKSIMTNRMSAPGIVMMYVSEEPETALRETVDKAGDYGIAEFVTMRDLLILDLCDLPPIPSIFENTPEILEYELRPSLIFLHTFAADLSKPIERDDRVHIEYIPTQIVTEYFRDRVYSDNRRVDGIRYESSRHPGFASIVLFANQEDIVPSEDEGDLFDFRQRDPWIKLVGTKRRSVTQDEIGSWQPKPHPLWI